MSGNTFNYSDEILNAYLDNELASEERQRLIEDIRDNEGLRQRVCDLEQVRNMVSIAYHDLPEAEKNHGHITHRLPSYARIAAGFLIVCGLIGGWFGHTFLQQNTQTLLEFAEAVQVNQPVNQDQPWKVLLHVTSDDDYRLNALLNETESILREFKAKQRKVSIQILANGNGLKMLRGDTSPYAKRIAELQKNHDNLVFMACAKAMARVQQKTGQTVPLLPNTQITPSALSEALNRQREGWTYIKI